MLLTFSLNVAKLPAFIRSAVIITNYPILIRECRIYRFTVVWLVVSGVMVSNGDCSATSRRKGADATEIEVRQTFGKLS